MEIRPANIDQFALARSGTPVLVEADVGGIAVALREVNHHLRLRYSEAGQFYVVYFKPCGCLECQSMGYLDPALFADEGCGDLVTTSEEIGQPLVDKVRRLDFERRHGKVNFADELDKLDAAREREADRKFEEATGDAGERFYSGMRRLLGKGNRAFFPNKEAE